MEDGESIAALTILLQTEIFLTMAVKAGEKYF